jgi:hypothetical protein
MAYAEPGDLAARWHPLTPEETSKATTLLDDAAFWLRVWVPGLQSAIDSGNADAATAAKLLTVSMVKRAMQNENDQSPGIASRQEVASIYQEIITYRNPEGNLYLYDRELADILAVVTGVPQGATSFTSPGL